mgnify:CR=1 FL=1
METAQLTTNAAAVDFAEIYNELGTPLRNFLFYKTGSLEQSKDLAQEAFIRLWNNVDRVQPGKMKNYLFTIANRLFLDETDHQKVKLKFQYSQKSTEAMLESNPEYIYRQEEFKESLEAAISDLSEQRRTVFLMSRIDKMANKEIAEALNITVKTVEKHITASLKQLRSSLNELNHVRI